MSELSTTDLLDRLQAEVKDSLVRCLSTRAVSLSSHEEKRTGNAYQPVRLGEQTLRGFRSGDRQVFAGINLKGKSVIDLGCNLGEIVRDAVRAGASSATGIEYDDYFVQVARYAAAYNRLGNVNYHQGDLTKAGTYDGAYDVVSALSVFTYIKNHIGRIAQMTKEVLVVETHSVRANWKSMYLKPLQEHFAHVAMVGVSDHKAANSIEHRYVLLCSQKPLDRYLIRRARELADAPTDFTADMTRSRIGHIDSFLTRIGADPTASFGEKLELAAQTWPNLTIDEVAEAVGRSGLVGAPEYWASLLLGYRQFLAQGSLGTDNFYFQSLKNLVESGKYDASFRAMFSNTEEALTRLDYRMHMLKRVHEDGVIDEPIVVFNPVRDIEALRPGHPYALHLDPVGANVWPLAFDGHHRLFAGKMAALTAVPVLPMWTETGATVGRLLEEQPGLRERVWDDVYGLNQLLCETA